MNTAADTCQTFAHSTDVDFLDYECLGHPALSALQRFNLNFASRPLQQAELITFFASMAAFNRHTIGGIAILAGRLSDEMLPRLPIEGHDIGAYVLDAAIDEYGLRETRNHVELARNFAAYLGVSTDEVENTTNACPTAIEIGNALFDWYRKEPPAFSLGAHVASEITSVREFVAWHDIFLIFPHYRFSLDTPEFEYMRTHYVHERDHTNKARACVARFLHVLPAEAESLRAGSRSYMDLYERMFRELDTLVFK